MEKFVIDKQLNSSGSNPLESLENQLKNKQEQVHEIDKKICRYEFHIEKIVC